jgi:hypothetical protein
VENASRSPEMKNFDNALRKVMKVSKADLKRLLGSDEAKAAVKPTSSRRPKTKAAPAVADNTSSTKERH